MDQVRHTSEIVELYSYPLKSFYSSVNSNDDELRIKNTGELDFTDARKCLTGSILRDDKATLMIQLKQFLETSPNQNIFKEDENRDAELLDRSIASKLLRLCCMFDSVECASALISGEFGTVPRVNELDDNGRSALHTAAEVHATRCIELLLRKRARTDLKSKDGQSQLALELSLSSRRMGVVWTVDDPIENLLVCLNQKDLTAVRLLSEKTKEIGEVAHAIAMDGQAVSLAALLMVAAEKVTTWIVPVRTDGEKKTIYDCVIKEALSLSPAAGEETCVLKNSSESSEKRRFLLCELELFLLYGAVAQSGSADKKVVSPLIRASQVGDEAVLKILLKTKMDLNEADVEGNSALHWALKMSPASVSKQIKIIWLLLKHGARVGQRNRLGLTAAHIASANGYIKALQILLLADPDGVHTTTEMKETPLFFAVKNDFMDCVELLLCWGANTEVLNLRKQRPIDFAKSQDMRFMLNPTKIGFMNRAFSSQQKFTAVSHEDEVVLETYESILAMMDEVSNTDRICPSNKTEICRYFESPGGCVRGAKCFYAHGEEELRQTKQGIKWFHSRTSELNRRVFVGGLPPSLDSESLGKFFEQFGSVEDAQVVAVQTENELQSRGFGFVTFKHESSVSVAVQEHYIIIMGKQVEIKSAVPKSLLLSELQKSPPQQQKEEQKSNQLEPQTPSTDGKNTDNNCNTEPISWADRVLRGQPKTYSNENQAHVSPTSMDQREPAWLTTFKKWLPKFLKDVSLRLREGEWYPLSSLKGDFRATRGLELDHASLGYLKLSEFMRSLPGICRMKIVPVGGRGPATHMVLLPNSPKLDPVVKTMKKPDTPPCTKSSDENGNGDSDDFMILQGAFFASYDDLDSYSNIGGDYLFHETPENNSDTLLIVRPSFFQFLEPDPLFLARPWLRNATGHADWEGEKGVTKPCNQERHLVLEALARKRNNTSVFFLREYDFYENYKASIAKGKCFACSQHQILWANYPCRHLLWCDKCKVHAAQAAGTSKHKCVICDAEVQRFELLPQQIQNVLQQATFDSNSQVGAIFQVLQTKELPPTYFRTNKFNSAIQEIVDAYGVAKYQEANPGVYTIITFPFLFAVMFGDWGHGICLLLATLYFIIREKKFSSQKLGDITEMTFGGRYVLMMMALFSIYTGLIYNEFFSVPFELFGSSAYACRDPSCRDASTVGLTKVHATYPFGVDPSWHGSRSELPFLNSMKMKMSILIGVAQMNLGIILSYFNAKFFTNNLNIWYQFVPQIIFLNSLFGYLSLLIIVKWCTGSQADLYHVMIYMFLSPTDDLGENQLFFGQKMLQLVLLLLALVAVPWMLIPKPFLLKKQHEERHQGQSYALLHSTDDNYEMESHHDSHGHEEFEFSEVFVHQLIHTIEFVLGSVSNTASYLRLWALSLAHSELSSVFYEKVLLLAWGYNNVVILIVGIIVFIFATVGVLLVMETLSAFLHALRLHWVEFQNKFYEGDGYKFYPYSFALLSEDDE